jgi:hypothetical protein
MCTNDQVTAVEDVGGYRVDSNRFGLVPVVVDDLLVAACHDRGSQLDRIKPYFLANSNQVVDIFEPARQFPMRFEKRVMHLLVLTLLARELRGAQRAARVDDQIALLHHEAYLSRDFCETASNLL